MNGNRNFSTGTHAGILGTAMIAIAMLAATAAPALAGCVLFTGQWDGQTYRADGIAAGKPAYTIRYSTIDVRIDGSNAETTIVEDIWPSGGGRMFGVCLIPLPAGVVAESVKVTVGEASDGAPTHEVTAKVLTADKAQAVCRGLARGLNDAKVTALAGRPAAMVTGLELPERARVTVRFRQKLATCSGVQTYVCPMPATAWSADAVGRLSLKATVTSARPLRAMFSPTHAAVVKRDGLREATVTVKADEFRGADDFRLCFVADADDLGLRVLAHRPDPNDDGFFLLVGSPTGSAQPRKPVAKDVLFVLDASGSMRGEKIEQARAAVEYCVGKLSADDRFNVVAFGTEVSAMAAQPVRADKQAIARARDFLENIVARGRTNISGALAKALAGEEKHGRMRIVIFLTDGTPTAGEVNAEKIVQAVPKMNTSGAKIFVMGVGNDVNAHLLDKLAECTEGSSEYVRPNEEVDARIASLYDRLSNPVLNNVALATGDMRASAVFPKKLPALFVGSEIMIAGRYRTAGNQRIVLSGTLAGDKAQYVCDVTLPEKTAVDANDFVAPLWASRKIGFLLREIRLNGENKELVDEIVRLSTRYGILTEYTSYLAGVTGPTSSRVRVNGGRREVLLGLKNRAGVPGVMMPAAAARPADAAAFVRGKLAEARGVQAGQWAVNQAVNEKELQDRKVATSEANVFLDRSGNLVKADNIRQIGSRTFYFRRPVGGQQGRRRRQGARGPEGQALQRRVLRAAQEGQGLRPRRVARLERADERWQRTHRGREGRQDATSTCPSRRPTSRSLPRRRPIRCGTSASTRSTRSIRSTRLAGPQAAVRRRSSRPSRRPSSPNPRTSRRTDKATPGEPNHATCIHYSRDLGCDVPGPVRPGGGAETHR